MTRSPSSLFRLSQLAPALFVLLWASGFIGAKFGLPHAEPFSFLTVRLTLTTSVLIGWALLRRLPWPARPAEFAHLAVAGLLLHGLYLGGVFSAIRLGVSPGVVALITGLQPLLVAAIASRLFDEPVTARQWLGLLLGLAGVVLVVWRAVRPFGGGALLPLLPVALALLGITLGSLYQKRFCGQMNMVTGTVLQYVAAGAAFAAMAYGLETRRIDWTGGFVFVLLWLALVLSVGAIFMLFLMIRNGQAARVASLFYLTPGATAIMAWLLFGETLTPLALTGFALTGVGVVLARRG